MEMEKKRISVTLTEPYLEVLNHLVEGRLYLSRGGVRLHEDKR
jgi:Arc/MetJ-type ribon-helix-helix transcriptional regulator